MDAVALQLNSMLSGVADLVDGSEGDSEMTEEEANLLRAQPDVSSSKNGHAVSGASSIKSASPTPSQTPQVSRSEPVASTSQVKIGSEASGHVTPKQQQQPHQAAGQRSSQPALARDAPKQSSARPSVQKSQSQQAPRQQQQQAASHPDGKPNHNLGNVVRGILSETPQGRMTLDEIVEVLARRFPYYRRDPAASRTAIRQCLAGNSLFRCDGTDSRARWFLVSSGQHAPHKPLPPPMRPHHPQPNHAAIEQQQRREAEQAKARRASQAGALLFTQDAQSSHPMLQENYALAFDYRIASMVNRALFVLTAPLLQQTSAAAAVNAAASSSSTSVSTAGEQPASTNSGAPAAKKQKLETGSSPAPAPQAPGVAQNTASQVHALVNAPMSNLTPLPPFISHFPPLTTHPALALTNPNLAQKPDLKVPELIREAIMASKDKRLTAVQLFEAIEARHPYYRRDTSYRAAVMQALSNNAAFASVQTPVQHPSRIASPRAPAAATPTPQPTPQQQQQHPPQQQSQHTQAQTPHPPPGHSSWVVR